MAERLCCSEAGSAHFLAEQLLRGAMGVFLNNTSHHLAGLLIVIQWVGDSNHKFDKIPREATHTAWVALDISLPIPWHTDSTMMRTYPRDAGRFEIFLHHVQGVCAFFDT